MILIISRHRPIFRCTSGMENIFIQIASGGGEGWGGETLFFSHFFFHFSFTELCVHGYLIHNLQTCLNLAKSSSP